MNEMIPIGQAAQMLGVTVDTLRVWESKGKITSRRLPSGHRRYVRSDVENLVTTRAS